MNLALKKLFSSFSIVFFTFLRPFWAIFGAFFIKIRYFFKSIQQNRKLTKESPEELFLIIFNSIAYFTIGN